MTCLKSVIFDFIGTLTSLKEYSLETAESKLFSQLAKAGACTDRGAFIEAYREAYRKNRKIRYEKLTEIPNSVWVSEALNDLGHSATPDDEIVKTAVNAFFEDYLEALRLRHSAYSTLNDIRQDYTLGLVSNFTHAPVIYAALRRLKIADFFSTVVVSEAIGWRKPHPRIFREALKHLGINAEETLYVGDTPLEDIQGAKSMNMKTVFIQSQFNTINDLKKSAYSSDFIIEELEELPCILSKQH